VTPEQKHNQGLVPVFTFVSRCISSSLSLSSPLRHSDFRRIPSSSYQHRRIPGYASESLADLLAALDEPHSTPHPRGGRQRARCLGPPSVIYESTASDDGGYSCRNLGDSTWRRRRRIADHRSSSAMPPDLSSSILNRSLTSRALLDFGDRKCTPMAAAHQRSGSISVDLPPTSRFGRERSCRDCDARRHRPAVPCTIGGE